MPSSNPDPETARRLLAEAWGGEVDNPRPSWDPGGFWRVRGLVRSDEPDLQALFGFLEELGEEAVGRPVLLEGPVLGDGIPSTVWKAVLAHAQAPEDVVRIARGPEGEVVVHARQAGQTLSRVRNRLPRLRRALPEERIVVVEQGRADPVDDLDTLPAVQAWLAPLVDGAFDPERVHAARVVKRSRSLHLVADVPELAPVERARLARSIRWRTGIDLRLDHRVSAHRARDTVHAALAARPDIERFKVRWDARVEGVEALVDAPAETLAGLGRLQERLEAELGVPVAIRQDRARELSVERIASAFPEDGILTHVRHLDGSLYEVGALLPLQGPEPLEAWADELEARWGVQVVLDEPRLYAPDLRHRDLLGPDRETIALRYNRPLAFSPEAAEQARRIAAAWEAEGAALPGRSLADRRDLRDLVVLSIDPERTRDLDDALSVEPAGPGRWRVGVHIADVAAFIEKDSPLDREALLRSFTTYLAEGEIPVLPEVLSHGVLSLHGGQDSPALSLFMEVDEEGVVHDFELLHSFIHNHCRFSYAGAQKVLDGADHPHAERLRTLDRIARNLRRRRKEAGSLDLSLEPDPEAPAHHLIEEWMLLANETVARFLVERHPDGLCLHRTHPDVLPGDWEPLRRVAEYLRIPVAIRDQRSLQEALEAALGTDAWPVLRYHVGQVLQKATYHFEALGHGALAKAHYAHFTSPIRRYSDVIVHRLVDDVLLGREPSYTREELVPIQDHLNAMEIRVDAASYESHRLDELRRYEGRGRIEPGTVVGLMRGRIHVLLDRTDLRVTVPHDDDRARAEPMPVRIEDRRTGWTLALGQRVMVQTRGVDWERKAIEAVIVSTEG